MRHLVFFAGATQQQSITVVLAAAATPLASLLCLLALPLAAAMEGHSRIEFNVDEAPEQPNELEEERKKHQQRSVLRY